MSSIPYCGQLMAWLVVFAFVGCGAAKPVDEAARFDREVDGVWKVRWPWVDALPFFQRGGRYVDTDDAEKARFDRPHVVPLLKAIGEEFDLHWHAVVQPDQRDFALAIVAELPTDLTIHKQIMAAIERHQQTFPGAILVQQGHRWLSLDFLTPEQEAFLNGKDETSTP